MSKERVNHPEHYGGGDNVYEVIKIIRHYGLGFSIGNVVKYVLRAGKKKSKDTLNKELEDLKKAKWYLEEEIAAKEEELNGRPPELP